MGQLGGITLQRGSMAEVQQQCRVQIALAGRRSGHVSSVIWKWTHFKGAG